MNLSPPLTPFGDLLKSVRDIVPDDRSIYLVGGAVRDALLNRPIHDLDFVVARGAIPTARHLANKMGASYFPLDKERDTGRVIVQQNNKTNLILDFSALRGPNLESDLRDRDLTINAMAIDLDVPQKILDPLGGADDLQKGVLRACSMNAYNNDPIRIIRTVRMAVDLGFRILPESKYAMQSSVEHLSNISCERVRDELFRVLDGLKAISAIRILDRLGALIYILPELDVLKGVSQSPPHIYNVWNHTLDVLEKLSDIVHVLSPEYDPESKPNWRMGLISLRLGRYRQQFEKHINSQLNPQRSLYSIISLAALYHDTGKPAAQSIDQEGRIRFFGHQKMSADIAVQRAEQLRLSHHEIQHLQTIINHHMRPLHLAQMETHPSRKAIYRFFRDTREAGIDICILSLADMLGTYGARLPDEIWSWQVEVTRELLEAWWEHPAEAITPPPLINGYELMEVFKLAPGAIIGCLLDEIKEGQAAGEIISREDALDFAQNLLEKNDKLASSHQG